MSYAPFMGDNKPPSVGLNPLGIRTASEQLFTTLLPGLNVVTLRIRYYSFYCWLLKSFYAKRTEAKKADLQRHIRMSELLMALIHAQSNFSGGVPGITRASEIIAKGEDIIDFNEDAMPKGKPVGGYWKAIDDDNMNFNAIVGNPPYQIMDGGAGVSAKPVYNEFVDIARKLSPSYISMIMPSRWYAGGKGLDSFRDSMLKDRHIVKLFDYFDATDVFPKIDLSGGICYFLWSVTYNGDCTVTTSRNGVRNTLLRSLLENGADSFIRFNEAVSIINKIPKEDQIFYKFVSPRKPFGIATDFKINKSITSGVKLFAYPNNGWIDILQVPAHKEWIGKYKVFISYAYGERGDFPYFSIGKPFYGYPMTCCSETYLVIYPCNSEEEMKNVAVYLRTKFLRFLVLLKKNTQHATSKVYSLVPFQNFTSKGDIDWSQSVADIDRQLYTKYKLTEDEIAFVESMIKPM